MNDYNHHKPNPRNFFGILIFLFGLTLYAFLIAAGGDLIEEAGVNTLLSMVYYAIFGILWVFPARFLFRWMAQGRQKMDAKD